MSAITSNNYSGMELSDLLAALNAEHGRAIRSARTTIDHATRCGEMLIEAKARIQHGQWETWLEDHTQVSLRTSQRYMRLASNTTSVSLLDGDMGIAEALEMISTPTTPKAAPAVKPKVEKPSVVTLEAEILEPLTEKESARLAELEAKIVNIINPPDDKDPIEAAIGKLVFVLLSRACSADYINSLAESVTMIENANREEKL
jgi:hypothetical protein